MLFALKRRPGPALAALSVVLALAAAVGALSGTAWRVAPSPEVPRLAALSLALMVTGDGAIHGALLLGAGERYRRAYAALAGYFSGQGAGAVLAGSLLAAGEEALFRGGLLEALAPPLGSGPALGISAVLFGIAHWVPERRLWPFTAWSAWQGLLLGGVYLVTGSLLVSMLAHAAHDALGFAALAVARRPAARAGGGSAVDAGSGPA